MQAFKFFAYVTNFRCNRFPIRIINNSIRGVYVDVVVGDDARTSTAAAAITVVSFGLR